MAATAEAGPPASQRPLSPDELARIDAWWRAANYLSVGQIYLLDNPLLTEPLRLEHVKPRLLGHWGTTPGLNFVYVHMNRVIVRDELERVVADGLTEAELERGKGHLEGSLVLGMEDTSGRMTRLGKSELTFGEILSVDEVIRRVDAVTDADVRAVAKEVLGTGPRALALIGPFDDDGFSQYLS